MAGPDMPQLAGLWHATYAVVLSACSVTELLAVRAAVIRVVVFLVP